MAKHKRKVFVYWNLHKGRYSVKDITPGSETYGLVIGWADEVLLADVEGKVSEAGRQRVLREGRKNVHAGIVGYLPDLSQFDLHRRLILSVGDTITYNPRKYTSFVHTVDESPFEGAAYALLSYNRAVYVA